VKQPTEGELVTPKIRLVRPLGAGGMGSVWLADHLALHTQVVVKFISAELANHKEAIARFEREAAAASQVKSPHVVQILDHGVTDEGTPFIVMELLEGRDLAVHLEKFGRMTVGEVAEVVAQLCRALSRAHERGIVHRDIKPQNIFLCDAGSGELFVKLLDFGIAKGASVEKLDTNTKTGTVVGSPYYMSPEQLVGAKDIDFRTDLWSVGVVAFEALTGMRAFDGETVGALALRIHNDPLPIPSARNDNLPPTVDEWFEHACARGPSGRFHSAKEMADAFAVAATGHGPSSVQRVSSNNAMLRSGPDTIALAKTAVDTGSGPISLGSGATPDPRVLSISGVSSGARPSARGRIAFAVAGVVVVAVAGLLLSQALRANKESAATTATPPPPATSALLPNIPPPPPLASLSPTTPAAGSAAPSATAPKLVGPHSRQHVPASSATHAPSASPPPPATTAATPHTGNEDDIR